jgi:hypothetical protein
VDLIVPEGIAQGGGRRGARLGAHGGRAARKVRGLEGVLLDRAPMTIEALDPDDGRRIRADVSGPAALLVAKAHKLHDRVERGRARRIDDQDATDVVRLMQTTDAVAVGATMRRLLTDRVAAAVTVEALDYLTELFGRRGRPGIEMAARALRTATPAARVTTVAVTYVRALRESAGVDGGRAG